MIFEIHIRKYVQFNSIAESYIIYTNALSKHRAILFIYKLIDKYENKDVNIVDFVNVISHHF